MKIKAPQGRLKANVIPIKPPRQKTHCDFILNLKLLLISYGHMLKVIRKKSLKI
jgi:hypothetical protein